METKNVNPQVKPVTYSTKCKYSNRLCYPDDFCWYNLLQKLFVYLFRFETRNFVNERNMLRKFYRFTEYEKLSGYF